MYSTSVMRKCVEWLIDGSTKWHVSAEWAQRRSGMSATLVNDPRLIGAPPGRTVYLRTEVLNLT